MKLMIVLAITALLFLDQQTAAWPPKEPPINEPPELKCVIEEGNDGMIERMLCSPFGLDGRTLGEILRQTQVFSTADGVQIIQELEYYHFKIPARAPAKGFASTLAPRVKHLQLVSPGNLTITDDCLADFRNLEFLKTDAFGRKKMIPYIHISPAAFQSTPNLTHLDIFFYNFSADAIKALESLRDQVDDLEIDSCYPSEEVLVLASKFTKLTNLYLDMDGRDGRPQCPLDLFQNSAKSLNRIHLYGCNMSHLPAATLTNLSSVTDLRLIFDDIRTVEPEAFDHLKNLERLYMRGNKIKLLPDGIFEKNKMLEIVDFSWNGLENLSRWNFTHCPGFQRLCVGEHYPYCPY